MTKLRTLHSPEDNRLNSGSSLRTCDSPDLRENNKLKLPDILNYK